MSWHAYRVILRLCSPMHIGQTKIGNVQRTRPYVTGRVLWGAFTQRLTRDRFHGQGPANRFEQYDAVGWEVHSLLAFTYFYPVTDPGGNVTLWPWDDGFRSRFLSTYASTALTYPQQSADEGTLHEVEFISPRTQDSDEQVYLVGYIFACEGAPEWKPALRRLQLGGERGYGWGRVELVRDPDPWDGKPLFDGRYTVNPDAWPPVLTAGANARLLAHALVAEFEGRKPIQDAQGEIEPLVGRETAPDGRFGVQISKARVCYAPGGKAKAGTRVRIGRYGVWEAADGSGCNSGAKGMN